MNTYTPLIYGECRTPDMDRGRKTRVSETTPQYHVHRAYSKVMLSLTSNDLYKRQATFNVLNNSMGASDREVFLRPHRGEPIWNQIHIGFFLSFPPQGSRIQLKIQLLNSLYFNTPS